MNHLDKRKFRDCLGQFATGITVITTMEGERPVGVTINSFTSVSLEPALILFCLDKQADCYSIFKKTNLFAVNILSAHQQEISHRFSRHIHNKWHHTPYHLGEYSKSPLLLDTKAYLECEKFALYPGGDHDIFLGKVLSFRIASDHSPLVYYRGQYCLLEAPNPS